MPGLERRFAPWPDLVAELVLSPATEDFPRRPVEDALVESFGCTVSFSWSEADGSFGFDLHGPVNPGFVRQEYLDEWARRGPLDHPLVQWFACHGNTSPMTVGRIPRGLVPAPSFARLEEMLGPYGCEQQLGLPFRMRGMEQRHYVMARGGEDFSDEDLALAVRIQPLLAVLDRQAQVLRERHHDAAGDLTGRELAVLRLLAEGHTALAISHRLGSSTRTVHKHLEHLYRKLGVRDRLRAVAVAREAGILAPLPPEPWRPRVSFVVWPGHGAAEVRV